MVVFLVGKDTLKISEAYINAFPAFSCPLFASKNPIVHPYDHILPIHSIILRCIQAIGPDGTPF